MCAEVLQDLTLFVPDNFNAEYILKTEAGNITLKRNLTDAMHYLLHTLIQMEMRQDKRHEMAFTGYFELNALHLKAISGCHYSKAAKILEQHGVISINHSYQTGVRNKGYCLIGNYAGAETKAVALHTDGGTKKRLLNWKQNQDKNNKHELEQIAYITKWHDKDRLTVDLSDAHDFIEFYRDLLIRQTPTNISPEKKINIENRINQRYNASIGVVKRIKNGDFNLYRLGQDQRLHSTITSVMKEFRSFLRFDGQPLVGIDVKSSQPYLLTQLLRTQIYNPSSDGLTVSNLYPELHHTIQNTPTLREEIERIIMLLTFKGVSQPPRTFFNIDWSADFYNLMIELEAVFYNAEKRLFLSRNLVKRTIMYTFYSKRTNKYAIPEWIRFEALFPVEAQLIRVFDDIGRLHNQNFLPIFLQRLESRIMLDRICYEISIKLPDAPIIPIHDSVLTTSGYVDQVEDIIRGQMFNITGIKPGLKREHKSAAEVLNDLKDICETDFKEIIKKLPKRPDRYQIKRKSPLLSQLPRWKGNQIFSTIYVD